MQRLLSTKGSEKNPFVKAGYVCPFLEKNSHFIFIKFKNLEEKAKNEIINFPEPRSRVYFLFWQRLQEKNLKMC